LFAGAGIDMELPNKDKFTGKDIFSLLLPEGLNMEFQAKFGKEFDTKEEKKANDAWVVIKNSKLVSGRMDKAAVGTEDGRVISRIINVAGPESARNFIDNCGRLGSAYLMHRGMSLGISDLDLPPKAMNQVKTRIEDAQKEADDLIKKYSKGQISTLPGMTPKQSLEAQILNCLASGISSVSDIVGEYVPFNDIISMAKSGAKGSMINLTQMAAAVGQETILGKRISRGFMKRTLPHFKKNDLSPKSRGFVASGFKQGLTPFELFWNIMNGREGLMDKSLRTRKSGYMQRRLVNALQDLKINDDMTVRNSVGEIIQFKAGEDGLDPSKSDFGKINWRSAAGVKPKFEEKPNLYTGRTEGV
jgi:DNA-directed RNA polymerase subunit A'